MKDRNTARQVPYYWVVLLFLMIAGDCAVAGHRTERRSAQADVVISNMSPEVAQHRAFKQAESNALESVARELSSVKQLLSEEQQGEVFQAFRMNISSRTSGIITDVDTVADTIISVTTPKGQQQLVYHVEIEALVTVEDIQGSSPYDFSARLKPRSRFEAGDECWLEVDVRQDSYLQILNITADNRVVILYPVDASEVQLVPAGSTFRFPHDGSRIRLYPLPGHDFDQEEFRIVATREPIIWLAGDIATTSGGGRFLDLPTTDMLTLEMEILRIPYDKRSQVSLSYEVFSKRD